MIMTKTIPKVNSRIFVLTVALCASLFSLAPNCLSQSTASPATPAQKQTKATAAGATKIDKAYLQKIWDGWATLNAAGQKQYYAQGPHVFFDDTPLKYANWDEYESTTSKELAEYKTASFKVNDDVQIHKTGDAYWATATVASDMTQKSGKREQSTLRWTVVLEKQNGKWLVVHEHVSLPQQ
jgi:ketosteroid isomerase-like protein